MGIAFDLTPYLQWPQPNLSVIPYFIGCSVARMVIDLVSLPPLLTMSLKKNRLLT